MAGKLPWVRAEIALRDAHNYWLVTVRPDGRPHAVPVWGVWFDGAFCFGTDRASRKGLNLERNPAVVVHLESGDDVVILEGRAALRRDADWIARLDQAFLAKYVNLGTGERYRVSQEPTVPAGRLGLFEVRPQRVLAWQEARFAESRTRWTFD